jgi:rare lipoprotein A (peptidoglycan hydrolase)
MRIVESLWVIVSVLLLIYISFSFWNAALSN